ncbi:MAG: transporter substrate-binding domain-containing protein [Oscillospiraceae bacterium]|nr:transporter substrate-binding domain-containing protein [Oscillospiraceae bacterium]
MKKIVSILLIACMIFAFAGCSSEENTLTVALSPDFAPMEFVDITKSGQDQYVGFDVMLANFIADEMGMKLKIEPMSFTACQVAVETKSVDMAISGFSWTEDRAENYNLSDYYYAGDNETEQVIITSKANEGKLAAAEDYAGLKVGAQAASLQLDLCKSQLPEDCEIVEIVDLTTALLMLKAGDIDALAVATGNAEVLISNNADDVALSGFIFEVDPKYTANVILLNKEDDELTAQVNEILAKAYEAGYYDVWYEEALELAEDENAADVTYDDEGNVATGDE